MAITLDGTTGITTPGLTNTGTTTIVALTTTGNTILGDASTDTLTVGVTGIVKDASGNVGIGTASPIRPLQVGAYGSGNGEIALGASTTGYNSILFGDSATDFYQGYVQYQHNGDFMVFATAAAERARIDSSGNLGIGTSSPTAKLQISVASAAVNGTKGVRITNPAGTIVMLECGSGGDSFVGTESGSDFNIRTNNVTRATFDNSGNLLVGSTSPTYSTTRSLFYQPTAGGNAIEARVQGANSSCLIASSTTATGILYYGYFVYNGTNTGGISSTGTVTVYGTTSDYRLKNSVAPMTGALEKVALLKPVTYKWNADGSNGEGFIAHELAEVIPDAVSGVKDAVDKDGKPQYQGVDTSFLVATLTAAIQEQQALITALTARITALESA